MVRSSILIFFIVSGVLISQPQIDYPRTGQVLQGVVMITGSTNLSGFQSAEVLFGFTSENGIASANWFLIHTSFDPVQKDTLAIWDTSTIADGTYDLRLLIHLEDGETVESIVRGLRVRNYMPIETDIQGKEETPDMSTPIATSTILMYEKTPTDFAKNELEMNQENYLRNIVHGLIIGAGSIFLVFIYSGIRIIIRKR